MANLSDKFSTYGLSLATAQVEYLLNSSSGTSGSDTSSFAYGAAGQSIVNISDSTNWVTKRVQSIVVMAPQDRITLEVSEDGNEWVDAVVRFPAMESGSNKYGCRVIQVSASSNQLDVQFGGNGANGTEAWSTYNTWRWRVRVTRGNLAAGFGQVSQSAAGLVQSAGQLLGTNTNDNANAGNVGEYIESVVTTAISMSANNVAADATTITLTAGDWDVESFFIFLGNGSTFAGGFDVTTWISGTAGNSMTGYVEGVTGSEYQSGTTTVPTRLPLSVPVVRVRSNGTDLLINGSTISSTQIIRLKSMPSGLSAGTPQYKCILRARRVR